MMKKLCVCIALYLLNVSNPILANDYSSGSTGYSTYPASYSSTAIDYNSSSANYSISPTANSPYPTYSNSANYSTSPTNYNSPNSAAYTTNPVPSNYPIYSSSTTDPSGYSVTSSTYGPYYDNYSSSSTIDPSGYSVSTSTYGPYYDNYSSGSAGYTASSTTYPVNYISDSSSYTASSPSYSTYPNAYPSDSTGYLVGSTEPSSYPVNYSSDASSYPAGSIDYPTYPSNSTGYLVGSTDPSSYPINYTSDSASYPAGSTGYTTYPSTYPSESGGYFVGSTESLPYSTNYTADSSNYMTGSSESAPYITTGYVASPSGYSSYPESVDNGFSNYMGYSAPYSSNYSLGSADYSPYSTNYSIDSADYSSYSPRYWLNSLRGYCSFNCMPNFFIGLGGSYNSVRLDRYINTNSQSNVFVGPNLVAAGPAGGRANPFHHTHCTFAPEFQLGFYKNLPCCNWLWGAKFVYRYLDVTFTDNNIESEATILPPVSTAPVDVFTGRVRIGSAQTSVNHELSLLAFIGHSFTCGHIYLGAGPVVFGTRSKIFRAIGLTEVDGLDLGITGDSRKFTNSRWLWGGAAQLGMVYYFSPCWFLDVNYYFAVTGRFKFRNSANFISNTGVVLRSEGSLSLRTAHRITAQSLSVSINRVF